MRCSFLRFTIAMLSLLGACSPAIAHVESNFSGGFLTGLVHPMIGVEHFTAMFAVGLWGAVLGHPSSWVLPILFPMIMAIGAVLGIAGFHITFVEQGTAVSSIVMGVFIASSSQIHIVITTIVVGLFAIFHGFAHGLEVPNSVNPTSYIAGFVIGTGLLHLLGIVIGLAKTLCGATVIRILGLAIAFLGVFFLVNSR